MHHRCSLDLIDWHVRLYLIRLFRVFTRLSVPALRHFFAKWFLFWNILLNIFDFSADDRLPYRFIILVDLLNVRQVLILLLVDLAFHCIFSFWFLFESTLLLILKDLFFVVMFSEPCPPRYVSLILRLDVC